MNSGAERTDLTQHDSRLDLTTGEEFSLTTTSPLGLRDTEINELWDRYLSEAGQARMSWTTHLRLIRKLGAGGQGVVFLAERRGADSFTLPVALKVFSPQRYRTAEDYDQDMERIGEIAARVAGIQHDNLLLVQNFLDRNRIRMMVMEWVEGFDLRRLLTTRMFAVMHERFSERRWRQVNEMLVTTGPEQPRFKAGVAMSIIRSCLEAVGALHREGIIHGDVKPANIMLKASGLAKIIDIGSAFDMNRPPPRRACTPTYAALEVLRGDPITHLCDLASIGYVTIELLAGRPVFSSETSLKRLIERKTNIIRELPELLPTEVTVNELLMSFIVNLVHPDPAARFPSAEAAVTMKNGAADFLRQLVKGDLSSEYQNDLRHWIEELLELDPQVLGET